MKVTATLSVSTPDHRREPEPVGAADDLSGDGLQRQLEASPEIGIGGHVQVQYVPGCDTAVVSPCGLGGMVTTVPRRARSRGLRGCARHAAFESM